MAFCFTASTGLYRFCKGPENLELSGFEKSMQHPFTYNGIIIHPHALVLVLLGLYITF